MPSSGMLRPVARVRTDVSEKRRASIIKVTGIVELGSPLPVTANVAPSAPILVTLIMEALRSSETSVLTNVTWRNIPEDGILLFCVSKCPASSRIELRTYFFTNRSLSCLRYGRQSGWSSRPGKDEFFSLLDVTQTGAWTDSQIHLSDVWAGKSSGVCSWLFICNCRRC
jgi:hypothetical protein